MQASDRRGTESAHTERVQLNFHTSAIDLVQQSFRQFVIDAIEFAGRVKVIVIRHARGTVAQHHDHLALAPRRRSWS